MRILKKDHKLSESHKYLLIEIKSALRICLILTIYGLENKYVSIYEKSSNE
jgi:hypothetical protein